MALDPRAGATDSGADAPIFTRSTRIDAPAQGDGTLGHAFATVSAVDAGTLVVGAPQADSASATDTGAIYIYSKLGANWEFTQKLVSPQPANGGKFGRAVAISGDTIVVGAPFENSDAGAAYVFRRVGDSWTLATELQPDLPRPVSKFGWSVAIRDGDIVVGQPFFCGGVSCSSLWWFERTGSSWQSRGALALPAVAAVEGHGSALSFGAGTLVAGNFVSEHVAVFRKQGSGWISQGLLQASDSGGDDEFGISVGAWGDFAIVGAPRDDIGSAVDRGSAYIFRWTGSSWSEQTKLLVAEAVAWERFGEAVALAEDLLIIGMPFDGEATSSYFGSAYLYARSANTWTRVASTAGNLQDVRGTSVALSGADIAIGSPGETSAAGRAAGTMNMFTWSGAALEPGTKIGLADSANLDYFGTGLAIVGNEVAVSMAGDDVPHQGAGSVHVYTTDRTSGLPLVTLRAPSPQPYEGFGTALASASNLLLVGAPFRDLTTNGQGAGYIYERTGQGYLGPKLLFLANGGLNERLGTAVAVLPDVAFLQRGGRGDVQIFQKVGDDWLASSGLAPPPENGAIGYGDALSASGNFLIVAAPSEANRGAVYVYERVVDQWIFRQRVFEPTVPAGAAFGGSVLVAGAELLVGAPGVFQPPPGPNFRGAVFVYFWNGAAFQFRQRVTPPRESTGDSGIALARHGEYLAVATREAAEGSSVFLYRFEGSNYVFEQELSSPASTRNFGASLAWDAAGLKVGAPQSPGQGPFATMSDGAVFKYYESLFEDGFE